MFAIPASPIACAVFPASGSAATPTAPFAAPFSFPPASAGLGEAACSVANYAVLGATATMA